MSYNLWIWTLQLSDDLKALVELGKHIHHRTGEQSVFGCDLELWGRKRCARRLKAGKEMCEELDSVHLRLYAVDGPFDAILS